MRKLFSRSGSFRDAVNFFLVKQYKLLMNHRYAPEKAIRKVNGYQMVLHPRLGGIHYDLFHYGAREPFTTQLLSKTLHSGDVVLDAGANIGYYALLESQKVGSKGFVYAVEPVKSNFCLLQQNIALNRFRNVEACNLAFGNRTGDAQIFLSDVPNLHSFNEVAVQSSYVGTESVKISTVDDFLVNRRLPCLVRMDVEGFELEILKGMRGLLEENVKLLIELHHKPPFMNAAQVKEMFDLLDSFGFKVSWAVGAQKVFESRTVRFFEPRYPWYCKNMALPVFFAELSKAAFFPNVLFVKEKAC
ncbi:MAG: FkbM family methyltransferase [Candidatus Bathyarchaeia archaeon]|jgi:FkbM family methyltransferase